MKNKFITFYTIFAAAAFAFSVAFFGVNVYKEYSQGESRANQRYNNLVNDLKTYTSIDKQFSQNSLENIKNTLGNLNDFSFIQLYANDTEILKYPKDASADLTVSNLTKSYSATFPAQNEQIKIVCNIYLLRPSSIYYYAKISFLIILIVTIITVILIFYINLQEKQIAKNVGEEQNDKNSEDFSDENEIERTPIFSENSVFDDENSNHNDDEKPEKNENEEISVSGENENSQNEDEQTTAQNENQNSCDNPGSEQKEKNQTTLAEAEENSACKNEKPADSKENGVTEGDAANEIGGAQKNETEKSSENQKVELPDFETPVKIEQNDENNPTGLFNPDGFGWESYLQTRLENEISRAISSEIDLAIFLIQMPQIQRESLEMKKISEYLTLQFQFKDLLFECKDSIAAIKISMNLDEALNFADKIHSELTKIINRKECFIGISTRNIRMVSAERLITEAQAALEHAKEDDSPIIAFRVDAGKYREFMEQN